MKTLGRLGLLNILIIGIVVILFPAVSVRAEGEKEKKLIAVVLDDSTSMVRDDPGHNSSDYTTLWEEADYAICALAATMDAGDLLRIYPLNGDGYIDREIGPNGLDQESLKNLQDGLSKMEYYGATPIDKVKTAADDLGKQSDKDCFLIVITDGNFKLENGKGNDMTSEELTAEFNDILKPNPRIVVEYLQIGRNEEKRFPQHDQVIIHQNKSGDITTEITEVINEIYHRVRMSEDDKKILIDDKTKGSVTINFDIPVKSVTVFMQTIEGQGEGFRSAECSNNAYNVLRTDIDAIQKDIRSLWKSNEDCNYDWIRNQGMNGVVFRFSSPEGSQESITISKIPDIGLNNIQVYYEPAVEQQITVSQDGGKPFIYKEGSNNIFVEGAVDFTIEYLDLKGNHIDDMADRDGKQEPVRLLKADSVKLEIGERELEGKRTADGCYIYSDNLETEDSDKELTVSNEIGLYGGKRMVSLGTIYEPYVDLSVELEKKEPKLVLDPEGDSELRVLVKDAKTGELIAKKWKDRIKLELESDYFKIGDSGCTYNEDGSIVIPVSVKDKTRYKFSGNATEVFTITASGNYDDKVRNPGGPERAPATTGKVDFNIDVTSEGHELSVEMDETEIEMFHAFLFGGEIPLVYKCDGDILSGENRKELTVELLGNDSLPDGLITLTDDAIVLKKWKWGWFGLRDRDYKIDLELSIKKWNADVSNACSLPLSLRPITMEQRLLLLVGTMFFVTLFLWFAFLNRSKIDYVRRDTVFQLKTVGGSEENDIVLSWDRREWLLFQINFRRSRYVHVGSHANTKKALAAKIDLYICKTKEGWKLGKLDQMNPPIEEGGFRIGDKAISDENCIFSIEQTKTAGELTIAYGQDKWKLYIEEK